MKQSITQLTDYGCGIACFAFACGVNYRQAEEFLGSDQAQSNRFIVKDFIAQLNRFGLPYKARHIHSGARVVYGEGMIVLIRRSRRYPVGHYLIRHKGKWMDPRINLTSQRDVRLAKSGYRSRLPGQPMYVLEPMA